ncbi:MAG TPA: prepilin-type N-terminal cleavage/methylation domain-containing protein [Xanthobacteraceae bacterium]|jgi:prepilin-type N-terminal cleavage/methylation domain-containing protein
MTSLGARWRIKRHAIRCIAEFMQSVAQRDGFTLIEVLAALAISSVIIVTTVTLIHMVAGNFDRGTRGVDAADGLMLAVQRLASDFGAARYTVWTTQTGFALAFKAERAGGEKPAQIVFVSEQPSESESPADEVVSLTIEQTDETTRLVRRRAAWTGPDMQIDHISPQDAVVLLEGDLDISFLFGRLAPGRGLVWSTAWIGETTPPRFVRLVLRDRKTGANPVGEADFTVRADAPLACGRSDAGTDCLSHLLPAARPRAALERLPG